MTENNKSVDKRRRLLIGLIIVLLLLTAGVYFFGVYFFTEHFLPGSYVNGFNCSFMTEEETEDLLTRQTDAYALAIQTRGNGQEALKSEEINLQYSSDGTVNKLLHQQNRFIWFLAFSQQQKYDLSSCVSYEDTMIDQKIDSLKCMQDQTEPVDAYIEENDDGFEVVSEVKGTKIDKEKLKEDIIDAVTTGRTVANLEDDGCYINPTVYSDDLTKDCEQMNELANVVITYDFDDRTETVDGSVIRGWLGRNEDGDLTLDKDAIANYIAELASKYDTVGTERTFSTYDGREVTVSGGNYGWVIDQDKETDALYNDIIDQKTEVRKPEYSQEASSRKTNDIGYTYIEIDLTQQRMVLYVDGNPTVDTGFEASSATPTGVYAIGEKQQSATPGGENRETVDYWMPFDDSIGIYGVSGLTVSTNVSESTGDELEADFDSSNDLGEDLTSGSWIGTTSGCVVVPEEQAQQIYENITAGTPVVIYK